MFEERTFCVNLIFFPQFLNVLFRLFNFTIGVTSHRASTFRGNFISVFMAHLTFIAIGFEICVVACVISLYSFWCILVLLDNSGPLIKCLWRFHTALLRRHLPPLTANLLLHWNIFVWWKIWQRTGDLGWGRQGILFVRIIFDFLLSSLLHSLKVVFDVSEPIYSCLSHTRGLERISKEVVSLGWESVFTENFCKVHLIMLLEADFSLSELAKILR